MQWKDIWDIAGKVYDELMFQGYAASRLTGLSPTEKIASRLARNAKLYKYLMSAVYGGMIVLTMAMGLLDRSYFAGISVTIFFWVYILVFLSAFQISFSISSSPHIRNFLSTLPLDPTELQATSAVSILRSVDAPILVSLIVPVFGGAIYGLTYAVNFLVASISGISLALATDVALSYGFRKVSVGSKVSGLIRAGSIIPVVLLAGVAYDVPIFIAQHWSSYLAFVPVLNLYWINRTCMALSGVYAVLFLALAVYGFSKQAIYLLTPEQYIGRSFEGEIKVKQTSPAVAIITLDFRQALRSRLAGMLAIPVIYFALAIITAVTSRSLISKDYLVFWGSYVVPMAFASAMLAYALYASEERGLATFMTLPISKLENFLSKCMVTMGIYAVVGALMSALVVYFGKPSYWLPIMLMEFPLMATVAFAGYYFSRVFKGGGAGMANSVTAVLFTIGVIFIIAIPSGAFMIAAFLTKNVASSSAALPALSLVEMAPFLYALSRDRRVASRGKMRMLALMRETFSLWL
ncbi:MAG: hypothetical protein ACP5T5_01745 [Thermoprotei archaeon]